MKKLLVAGAGLIVCTCAFSATKGTLDVSAVIQKGCLFQESPAGLDYGTQASTSRDSNVTASIRNDKSTWSIECTPDVPVSISFGNGNNYDAATQTRRMKNADGNYYVPYMLYSDSNRSKIIGTSAPSSAISLKSTVANNLLDFGVYGRVDLSQGALNKAPGKYTDSVLITITW